MTLPPDVDATIGALTARLDEKLPGQLEALYLVGSLALGDYHSGCSDIDFVAVLAEPHDLAALAEIHADLANRFTTHCDGIYLRPDELSRPPQGMGPSARGGRVVPLSVDERHAVTWLTLAERGIAMRGRAADAGWIAANRSAAIAHSRTNLEAYWRPWIEHRRSLWSRSGLALLSGSTVVWGCLGIARLHAVITSGQVLSKTSAGDYALAAFPEHTEIVQEALRLRRGEPSRYRSRLKRRREALGFMAAVLADATLATPERRA